MAAITSTASSARTITRLLQLPSSYSPPIIGRRTSNPIRRLSYSANDWKPLMVDNFGDLMCKFSWTGDKNHWFVTFPNARFQFYSEKSMIDFYVNQLATAVGSEEEAKRKMYVVSSGKCGTFGFGAEVDEDTINKIKGYIWEDRQYSSRKKNDLSVAARCTLQNKNHRLDNIFSYHHLSVRNPEWKFDHWLVNVKQPHGGFANTPQTVQYCIEILAKAVGSEEEAIEKMYMIWFKSPYGFAAKIDKETMKKLEGLSEVIKVLPDYAFDVEADNALFICPP